MKKAVIGGVVAAGIAAGAIGLAAPAQSASNSANGKTITLLVKNFQFGAKANNVISAKVGDKLLFKWVSGVHNVVETVHPSGTTKVNSGSPKAGHAPLTVTLSKKGTYTFVCTPHLQLGMKVTVHVS
jgi:plastocyanin